MEIYALIGHSGTGKSHQAPVMARRYNIEYIIDDGLLIKGNHALAGRSAKRENTRYGAIKRALFKDETHAGQVKGKLKEIKPGKLLIIGTSRRMTEIIAQNLGLEQPTYYFTIEEISSPESIETALTVRAKTNRHVIPLPTFAIKKDFPGYIVKPLRSFFSLPAATQAEPPVERSVVRPVFSTLGGFYIAEHVIIALVEYIASSIPGVHKVMHTALENGNSKVYLHLDLAVNILNIPDQKIDSLLKNVQAILKEQIEYQTGFYLDQVNVYAKKLHLDEDLIKDKEAMRKLISTS